MRVQLQSTPIRDNDNVYVAANVPLLSGDNVTAAPVKIISFKTKFGCRGFIRSLSNAVSAGGESMLTFRLLINGARQFPYDAITNQLSDPANPNDLPDRIPVSQGSLIEVQVDNADPANAFTATARVIVDYEDF